MLYVMKGKREREAEALFGNCKLLRRKISVGRAASKVLQLLKFGEGSFTVSATQKDGIGGGEGRRVSSRCCCCRGASAPTAGPTELKEAPRSRKNVAKLKTKSILFRTNYFER